MKSIIYICPTGKNKPTGGIKIIYRHVEILSKLMPEKINSKIFHFENLNFSCNWFSHKVNFKKNATFDPTREFVIIPEWMAVYHAKILQKAGVRYGIFVQNGFYLGSKPKNNFSDQDVVEAYEKANVILSYSNEITECIKLTFPKSEKKILKINISVNRNKFYSTKKIFRNKENLITYMPRKKFDHLQKLLFILKQHLPSNWKVNSIDNVPESEVARLLQKSKIFLSFSELEGFGLPPLEAALCGNSVVGYTGESGKEYWTQPIFDEVYSGDLRTYANKIINKVKDFNKDENFSNKFETQINQLTEKYSMEKEEQSLLPLINLIKDI